MAGIGLKGKYTFNLLFPFCLLFNLLSMTLSTASYQICDGPMLGTCTTNERAEV